jgi:riboflavin synthase
MFTGIVETLGRLTSIKKEGENIHFTIASSISEELKIDQSVSHNGTCLTVVALAEGTHTVTAIKETLDITSLGILEEGDFVNLERAMKLGDRLDGHMVQGHVDTTAEVLSVEEESGSWRVQFKLLEGPRHLIIEKGSITIDGTSLTLVEAEPECFSVAIIPYTWEHTRFNSYKPGTKVNIEFDLIGKYIARLIGKSS